MFIYYEELVHGMLKAKKDWSPQQKTQEMY